jgi:hypothetical protein
MADDPLRLFLLAALVVAALTTAALAFAWWMEAERRLRRALDRTLGKGAEIEAVAIPEGRAAAMDFSEGQVAVLWRRGGAGLIYDFDEVDGGELIIDGHVVARVRRGERPRSLDIMAPDAEQVVLRLLFNDPQNPEFELALWSALAPGRTGSPAEAMRLGRRWLSHLEALLKR